MLILIPLYCYAIYAHFKWIPLVKEKRIISLTGIGWLCLLTYQMSNPPMQALKILSLMLLLVPIFSILGIPSKTHIKIPVLLGLAQYTLPQFPLDIIMILAICPMLHIRNKNEVLIKRNYYIFAFLFMIGSYLQISLIIFLAYIFLYFIQLLFFAKIRIKENLCINSV